MMAQDQTQNTPYTGRCNCGDVTYTAVKLRDIWYCHCEQCRRATGHYMAAAQCALTDIQIEGEPQWYYVSENARHGFCSRCGSQLFWRNDQHDYLSVTGGSLDNSGGVNVAGHIFTGEKGDYYVIDQQCLKFIAGWC